MITLTGARGAHRQAVFPPEVTNSPSAGGRQCLSQDLFFFGPLLRPLTRTWTNIMKRLSLSVIALAAAMPCMAIAQDIALDEIVISANRVAGEKSKTGVSVAVVSEADLKKRRDLSLAQTLAALPGVSFAQQGPFGNQGNLRIRGADGRYLAVFVDGIRVTDPSGTTVSFDFGSMMTADVGRIEVLRGSQSALWGGSAVGGVINITTRGALEDGTHQQASVEGGSFGTSRLAYGFTQKDDKMELSFNLSHLHTDGFSAFDGGTERDGATVSRMTLSGRYQVNDTLALGGAIIAQETEQDYDGYVAFALADVLNNSQKRREVGARVFAEIAAGSTDHRLELSAFDVDRTYVQPTGTDTFSGQRLTFGYQGTTTASDALTFVYGLDWNEETANYTNLPGSTATNRTAGAFAQAIWSPSDTLDLSATLRADKNSGFGTFSTGRLAAAWRPSEGTTLRASVASGFRAPRLMSGSVTIPDLSPLSETPPSCPKKASAMNWASNTAMPQGQAYRRRCSGSKWTI